MVLGTLLTAPEAGAAEPAGNGSKASLGEALASPTPTLTPEQVVRIQLEALRGNDATDEGIALCYLFASPNNKSFTGPLPRFTRMIEESTYSLMLSYRQAAYETMEVMGQAARQKVTLYGDGQAMTFTFYLAKQDHQACRGCWMTEAVTAEATRGRSI
jgi:hypothetical protein